MEDEFIAAIGEFSLHVAAKMMGKTVVSEHEALPGNAVEVDRTALANAVLDSCVEQASEIVTKLGLISQLNDERGDFGLIVGIIAREQLSVIEYADRHTAFAYPRLLPQRGRELHARRSRVAGAGISMNNNSHRAVRQVLHEAAQHEHFFDLSDAERLNWMIARAFQIGKEQRHVSSNHIYTDKSPLLGELKKKRSKPMRQLPASAGTAHSRHTAARIVRGNDHRKS